MPSRNVSTRSVRGDFPSQAENAIIALSLVEDALGRWEDIPAEGRLVLGVDVARFGDDETVIFPVRGKKALLPIVLRSMDAVQVAGKVLEVARELAISGELPLIKVDSIGVGSGVADFLRYRSQVECAAVNVANVATVEEYALLRDQLWFGVQKWLKDGGAIPAACPYRRSGRWPRVILSRAIVTDILKWGLAPQLATDSDRGKASAR